MADSAFRYTIGGLDNVFLLDGYTVKNGKRGRVVSIEDIEGLHAAIGSILIREKKGLSGKELRFLRNEMGLSQPALAKLLGENEQSVARREKRNEGTKTIGAQERMIRLLYEQYIGGDEDIANFLKMLSDQNDRRRDEWKFKKEETWSRAA